MCRSPKSEDFQPPKEKKAIGTGIGTLMPTSLSFWKRRAARPERVKMVEALFVDRLSSDFQREDKTMRAVKLTSSIAAVFTVIALGIAAGRAQELEEVKTVFEHAIPNIPGKSLIAFVVTYPPGGKTPSHHHAKSAFIYARVLSGAIRSQVDDEPAKVYRVGEGFYEVPGAHHRVSENASDRESASLLAVFVVDSKDKPETIPDPK